MNQYMELGPELKSGVREIVATHSWRISPPPLSKTGKFRLLDGKSRGLRSLVTDYCLLPDGRIELKAPLLKQIREDNRRSGGPPGIVWGAMGFGYGSSFQWFNYAVVRELVACAAPVRALSWGKIDASLDRMPRVRNDEDIRNRIVILNTRRRVPTTQFQRCSRLASTLFGYFQCEGTRVPAWLVDFMKHFDVMLATSEATKKAIEESGVGVPVHVFGHGIDPAQFPFTDRPVDRKPYTFFHFADVQWRKGTDLLIAAFKALPRKDIRLYIKAQWENPESFDYRKLTASDPRVVWDFKRYKPSELAALVAKMDCGVFPSRGEGFGIPKLECEATGLPCIATDAFGYADTSSPGGTISLNVKEWVPARVDSGQQAEPDLDHLISLITKCADDPAWTKERGCVSSWNAHNRWKWSDKVAELLETLKGYGLTKSGLR